MAVAIRQRDLSPSAGGGVNAVLTKIQSPSRFPSRPLIRIIFRFPRFSSWWWASTLAGPGTTSTDAVIKTGISPVAALERGDRCSTLTGYPLMLNAVTITSGKGLSDSAARCHTAKLL
jgi:hypothetical protein